jgi:hypothetical protein
MHSGTEIMPESRQRQFHGSNRTARNYFRFEDINPKPGLCEDDGRRQAIRPGTHDASFTNVCHEKNSVMIILAIA